MGQGALPSDRTLAVAAFAGCGGVGAEGAIGARIGFDDAGPIGVPFCRINTKSC